MVRLNPAFIPGFALALLVGLAADSGRAQAASGKSGGSRFPSFLELLVLQDDGAQGGSPEGGIEFEDVDPFVFEALASDLLTQSEIGINRPGEIPIRPDRAIKAGLLRIYPLVRQQLVFDTNPFLVDSVKAQRDAGNAIRSGKRANDFISVTDIGFLSQVEFGEAHTFEFGGKISHNESLGSSVDFREEFAGGSVTLDLNRLQLKVGDRWEHRFDPLEIEFTNKLERTINTAFLDSELDLDGYGLDVDFQREDDRFVDARTAVGVAAGSRGLSTNNRTESTLEVRPKVAIEEETWIFLEYAYLDRRTEKTDLPSAMANRFSVGVEGNFNERLRLFSRVGWIHQKFETDAYTRVPPVPPNPPSDNDPNQIIPFTDPGDSTLGDIQAYLSAEYDLEDLTQLEVSYQRVSQFSSTSNFQMLDRLDVALVRQFYPRMLGRVGGFVDHARPSNAKDFSRFGGGVGFQYLLTDFISFDGDYSYKQRNSSQRGADYVVHIVAIGATLRF